MDPNHVISCFCVPTQVAEPWHFTLVTLLVLFIMNLMIFANSPTEGITLGAPVIVLNIPLHGYFGAVVIQAGRSLSCFSLFRISPL